MYSLLRAQVMNSAYNTQMVSTPKYQCPRLRVVHFLKGTINILIVFIINSNKIITSKTKNQTYYKSREISDKLLGKEQPVVFLDAIIFKGILLTERTVKKKIKTISFEESEAYMYVTLCLCRFIKQNVFKGSIISLLYKFHWFYS